VVGKDLDWEWGAMEVVSPGFKGTDDGEEFVVIDIVVSFCLRERLGEVGTGVPISIGVHLEEDSTRCVFRGIGSDGEGGGEIGEVKDGFLQEKGFEGVKGGLAGGSPVPLEVLFCKVDEGAGNVGVVRNESSVEVGKAKEGAYVLDFSWGWPFGNSVKFDGVHSELTRFDNHSEVFYLVSGKLAFLKFEMQVEFSHSLEDALSVLLVSGGIRGEDEEVVHIDNSHPSAIMSLKESFMNRWKVAGELVRPKNITVGSKRPLWVTKAAFH